MKTKLTSSLNQNKPWHVCLKIRLSVRPENLPSDGEGKRFNALTAAASSFMNWLKSNVDIVNWLKLLSSDRS